MFIRKSMLLAAVSALAIAACDNSKNETKTEPNPGTTTTPPATQPVTNTNATVNTPTATPTPPAAVDPIAAATNAANVKQYPSETKLPAPLPAKLISTTAAVRISPQGGEQIQVVKHGMDVNVVAQDKDYYLVLYPDPKEASKQMAGWVYKDALDLSGGALGAKGEKGEQGTAGSAANAKTGATTKPAGALGASAKLTCKTGEAHILTDRDFCATSCKDDKDCAKLGGVCDGDGKVVAASGATTNSRYCVGMTAAGESMPNMGSTGNTASPATTANTPSSPKTPTSPNTNAPSKP
jgi:hypothetical protein